MSERADAGTKQEGEAVSRPAEQARRPGGSVAICPERCKGCGYCVEFCPLGVLAMSARFNAKGYHFPEIVNGADCSGCDLCGMYCPDFAITGARGPRK